MAAMEAGSVTSTTKPCASPPAPRTSSTAASTVLRSRSQTTTFAPSRANLSAVAWPMPRAAPVMMQTLPASLMRLPFPVLGCLDAADSSRICGVAQRRIGDRLISAAARRRSLCDSAPPRGRKNARSTSPHSSASTPALHLGVMVQARLREQVDDAARCTGLRIGCAEHDPRRRARAMMAPTHMAQGSSVT